MKLFVFLAVVLGVLMGAAVVTGTPANDVALRDIVEDFVYALGDVLVKRDVTDISTVTATAETTVCNGPASAPASAPAAPSVVNTVVTSNVPAAPSVSTQPLCQIGDGQIQGGNGAECAASTITSTLTSNLVFVPPTQTAGTNPPQYTPPGSVTFTINPPPGESYTTLSNTVPPSSLSLTTLSLSVSPSTQTLTKSTVTSTSTPPSQETGGSGVASGDVAHLGLVIAIAAVFVPVAL